MAERAEPGLDGGWQSAQRRAATAFVVLAAVWSAAFLVEALPLAPTLLGGGLLTGALGVWVRRELPDPPRWGGSARSLAAAVAIGAAHFGVGVVLFEAAAPLMPALTDAAAVVYDRLDATSTGWRVVLAAGVIAPLEEVFWRGAMQPVVAARLRSRALPTVVAAATALYAAFHVATWQLPLVAAAVLGGLVWGAMVARTGTLAPAMVAHGVWTGLMVAFPLG